jgi:hypothetical protein
MICIVNVLLTVLPMYDSEFRVVVALFGFICFRLLVDSGIACLLRNL